MFDTNTRIRWSRNGFEQTHLTVQMELDDLAKTECIDRKREYLMGFSQGSLQARALLLSPSGRQPTPTKSKARGKRVVVINCENEGSGSVKMAEAFRTLFRNGNEVQFRVHEGEHEFPADWQRSLPQALHWLMITEG